ncbi:MAG: erythromycin esterase family protein [Bryobacteraceae bacterium]
MKSAFWRLVSLALFCPALLTAQSALNLNFQNTTYNLPDGWYFGGGPFQYSIDTSTTYSSTQSLKIASLGADTTQFGDASLILSAPPAIGGTFNLSGAIRTQNVSGYAGLWVNVSNGQNTLALQNLGSQAPSGTTNWQVYNLSVTVPAGAVYIDFGVLLSGTGTAWFDDLSVNVNGSPYFPNPTSAQVQWIQDNAFPFTSLDPNNTDFSDLQPLKQVVGNAQIVGLGEGTHGTSEFFQWKSRMVSFLAQQMGFTIFAIEANMPEAYRLNDYILTGIGDPKQLLLGMYFWTWNTQEVLDMIEWMRQYNASGQGTIQFLGFDMQFPGPALDFVARFVRQADPTLIESVNNLYGLVSPLNLPTYATQSTMYEYQDALSAAETLVSQLQANRDQYLETMLAQEVDWAIQCANIVVEDLQLCIGGDTTVRDAAMAANVEWIASEAPPGSRIVLWAHDAHINKLPSTMGGGLSQYFGTNYLAFGSGFNSGTYRSVGADGLGDFTNAGAVPLTALDSFPGSAEYVFHETGTPQQMVDLRLANANDPASAWLLNETEFRSIGAVEEDGIREFGATTLTQSFDALAFFDQTTASVELPFVPMNLCVFAPVIAPLGTLGVPYVQAPAPGNGTPAPMPPGTANVPYYQTLMAGGGVWPYGPWTVTGGALPAGLTLGLDGVLSGTPTASGSFTFTVLTTDSTTLPVQGQVSVTINPASPANAFSTQSATAGQVEAYAAQSIVAAYGSNFAGGTAGATVVPLPTTLDGTVVTVTDSAGVTRLAPLFYVSAMQINYEIPQGTAPGAATVIITNHSGVSQTETIQVGNVSPGLFALDSSGLVAAWVLPVISEAQQNLQPVYQVVSGKIVPLPINLSTPDSQYYLEIYGTGIRNAANVTVTVGGVNVPVLYHSSAPNYAGLDQVNIGPLPGSLTGQGNVNIVLTADGVAANTVNVSIQ